MVNIWMGIYFNKVNEWCWLSSELMVHPENVSISTSSGWIISNDARDLHDTYLLMDVLIIISHRHYHHQHDSHDDKGRWKSHFLQQQQKIINR